MMFYSSSIQKSKIEIKNLEKFIEDTETSIKDVIYREKPEMDDIKKIIAEIHELEAQYIENKRNEIFLENKQNFSEFENENNLKKNCKEKTQIILKINQQLESFKKFMKDLEDDYVIFFFNFSDIFKKKISKLFLPN